MGDGEREGVRRERMQGRGEGHGGEGLLRAGTQGRRFCAPLSTQYLAPNVFAELKRLAEAGSSGPWRTCGPRSQGRACILGFLRDLANLGQPWSSSPSCFIFFSSIEIKDRKDSKHFNIS